MSLPNIQLFAAGLPIPYKYESLLAETLFSQLLRVPAPAHKPVAYAALMVDLCKLLPTFPRSMSACVRECFSRCVMICVVPCTPVRMVCASLCHVCLAAVSRTSGFVPRCDAAMLPHVTTARSCAVPWCTSRVTAKLWRLHLARRWADRAFKML